MTEQTDGHGPISPEEKASEVLDKWVLDAHAKAAKSLTDLGLIQPHPESKGFMISPNITRKPLGSSLLEVSRDSKIDPAQLPWPLNQSDAGLWAEKDGRILLDWNDGTLRTYVELRPGNPADSIDPIKMVVSKRKSSSTAVVQEYSEGMFGFSYSHYRGSGTMITTESFTPKVWTQEEVDAARKRLLKKSVLTTSPRGMININHAREREELKLRKLAELTENGPFQEAISKVHSRQASVIEFTDSEAWKIVNAVNDSLANAVTGRPIQPPSRFDRLFRR